MDESKTALRLFREGRNRMYQWIQKWMGRGANDETEERGDPVDVTHVVNLLRAGLGFRLRRVDQADAMAHSEDGPGCRVVVSCTFSGMRAVLELPQTTCCCRRPDLDSDTNFWSVSTSSESIHEAGSSSLPQLNQGLVKVVKEVISQLHHVVVELNNPLAIKEIATRVLTTGSLQSLTPSPGMEIMRRVSSSPILSQDTSTIWTNQGPKLQLKREDSTVSLKEFPSIPSIEVSPIKGSNAKSVPPYRTSSPRSVQSSLERLSIKSNSNIVEKLEDIVKDLGQVISLAKGNRTNLIEKTRKASTVSNQTPDSIRKQPVRRGIPSSVPGTPQKRMLATPQTLHRDRTVTIRAQSTVKKFFSGSKLRTTQTETSNMSAKATAVVAKRRIPQQATPKPDSKLKVGPKKLAK